MANPKYGSLMFYPTVDKIKWCERISNTVDPGTEIDLNFRPHLTVLYGFDNSVMDIDLLRILVNNFIFNNQFSLHADHVSTFDNNSPIVKIDIIDLNGNLTKLNEILRHEFKCEIEYPIFIPHITIGRLLHSAIVIQHKEIDVKEFGFENINEGVFRYYDGVKNMIDL